MIFDNPAYTWPRGAITICVALGLLNTIFLLNRVNPTWSSPPWTPTPVTKAEQPLNITDNIANATLGVSEAKWILLATVDTTNELTGRPVPRQFESVMAVGLPERSDKRDALSLMAAMTGFKLTWVDGVLGSSIAEKAIPAVSRPSRRYSVV